MTNPKVRIACPGGPPALIRKERVCATIGILVTGASMLPARLVAEADLPPHEPQRMRELLDERLADLEDEP